jgi:hypothetical protein
MIEHLPQEERKAIRKLIESLLKGGEDLEGIQMADHAVTKGVVQQVAVILEGLEKPEPVAIGWAKDFDSAKVMTDTPRAPSREAGGTTAAKPAPQRARAQHSLYA